MFKGQSLTFSFISYLKRQEKTTSKTGRRRDGTRTENAIELPRVGLSRTKCLSDFSDAKQQLLLAREFFNKTASDGG